MKAIKIEVKWALIFTAMMLLWMFGEKSFGFHDERIEMHPIVTNFVAIPAILIFVLTLRDKRKRYYNGKMTYLQGFLCGFLTSIFCTILAPFMLYLTFEYITPDFFKNAISVSLQKNEMTQEAAEAYFNVKSYMVQATVGSLIMGTVTSAIVAIFTRKK